MQELFQILVVAEDRQDGEAVREKLAHGEGPTFEVQFADSAIGALDCLVRTRVDAVLLDPLGPHCYGMQGLASIRTHSPHVPVLIWTTWEDPEFARQAVAAGAHDCLIKDRLSSAALSRALHYAIMRHRASPVAQAERAAPVLAGVLGVKGGVGTTTLACHLSAELRRQTGQPVLLSDLDLYAGQTAFLMKANSPHSVGDAVANVHRLDTTLWAGLVASGQADVDVLPSPCFGGVEELPEVHRVRFLFRILRAQYPWMVMDLARLNRFSAGLLGDLDYLLLVSTADVQALLETRRLLTRLPELGCPREKVRLILSRLPRRPATSVEEVEQLMSFPVSGLIRDVYFDLVQAATAGTLMPADSDFGRQIAALAPILTGRQIAKRQQEGLIASLAKRMNVLRTEKGEEAPAAAAPEG